MLFLTIKDCGDPPTVHHGTVTLIDNFNTSYKAEATLVCEKGYQASSGRLLCDETGYWESIACTLIGKIIYDIMFSILIIF
jgi:hypothetical protein